jgi:protein phosphatase
VTSSVDTDVALNKPLPSEIDVFGLTHIGKVRSSNADHFLVASFHRAMRIHASSIRAEAFTPLSTYSRGYLFLVADGVGAFAQAADGSAHAIQSIAQYVLDMAEIGLQAQPTQEAEVAERLRTAVVQAHESLLTLGASGRAATTLTMWIGIWPRAFIIHAGDSRCYRLRGGVLERLTTDQTMAQAMIEAGAIRSDSAEASRLKHILISALGSSQMDLQVIMTDTERTDVMLLCSDGLTKHVSDEEIRERLASGAGAVSICSQLVDLALARGGEDNVTVIVGRARS